MRKCVAIMALAALGLAGCGEKGADTNTSAAPAATESAGATGSPGGGEAAPAAAADSVWTRAGRQADKSDDAAAGGEQK